MSVLSELQNTVQDMVQAGKGILAADESHPTIEKRFAAIDVESTEDQRREYRSLLLTTPRLSECISAVILFEETLWQAGSSGVLLPALAQEQGIVPGIKVDKGLVALPRSNSERITQGLDSLGERLLRYKEAGARFAKWRCVYDIDKGKPSAQAIRANAEVLARYAAHCQSLGIVPIVEPEVLIDGAHSLELCSQLTEAVQHEVFNALYQHRVMYEYMLLKPSMVIPGNQANRATPEQIANATLRVIKRTVPAAVPSINFLSGGQSPVEATANLNAINVAETNAPWLLSFSYGRALQEPVLKRWLGRKANTEAAQHALQFRAVQNAAAVCGEYSSQSESQYDADFAKI